MSFETKIIKVAEGQTLVVQPKEQETISVTVNGPVTYRLHDTLYFYIFFFFLIVIGATFGGAVWPKLF